MTETLNDDQVLDLLRASDALREGHFLLTSGKHSNRYFQCALVLQYPDRAGRLATALAHKLGAQIDVVVGPAMGAVTWAYEMGRALGVRALFTERVDGAMQLRRGFQVSPGERVLVVEDVVTSGGSAREVCELLSQRGADVRAVGCIVDRNGGRPFGEVPFVPLVSVEVEAWEPADCPLCAAGAEPAEKPGSRTAARP